MTPLPPQRLLSPSRSSTASCAPVEAPDGTAARPMLPSSSVTSTSTVGLPRLSRIWRAWTSTIAVMAFLLAAANDYQGVRAAIGRAAKRATFPSAARNEAAMLRLGAGKGGPHG